MLKAVIFDFDGVLADSVPVYQQAVKDTIGQAGVDGFDDGLIAAADTRTVAQRIIEQYNLTVDVETMTRQIEKNALDRLLTVHSIVPGARALVEVFRDAKLKTAIASLAPRRNIDSVLKQAGMTEHFDAIISVDDISRLKPDPEVFLKAARAVGVDPGDCVGIEDSDKGVTAINAAEMVSIALTTTFPVDRLTHAKLIVRGLSDLSLDLVRETHQFCSG